MWLCLVIPIIIRKVKKFFCRMENSLWNYRYCIAGGSCGCNWFCVLWCNAWFTVAGINIQPSELVKIVFVFFVASSFKRSTEFKDIVVTTAVAAFHVLILVASKDLGAALIIFVVYLVMLYVATRSAALYSRRTWCGKCRSSWGLSSCLRTLRRVWSPVERSVWNI